MDLNVNITGIDEELDSIVLMMDQQAIESVNKRAGAEVLRFVSSWYTEHGRDLFVKPGPTHGAGRAESGWAKMIPSMWVFETNDSGFTVTFADNGYGLRMKLEGGTISAKNARALTIPMVPEAHGVRVRDYPGRLFSIKKKDGGKPGYLFEKTQGGGIRAVYALRKSVQIKENRSVLPSDEEFLDAGHGAFANQIFVVLGLGGDGE